MLSLRELRRVVRVLSEERSGARVDKVVQPAGDELVLELSGGGDRPAGDRCRLLLSCRPGSARISALARGRPAPPTPLPFAQFLRPRLVGARLRDAGLRSEDRQASLRFESREGRFELLLSILGPRSNLYLLDGAGLLLWSARPLAETRRELAQGEPWRDPESRPPTEGEDRFAETPDAELLAAVEGHYADREGEAEEDRERRRLGRALDKARAAVERKIARLEEEAREGDEAAALERRGELLKASLSRVAPGDQEVVVRDFETDEPVTVPLDPKRSAAENLDALFRRARKAQRRALKAATELGGLLARREELAALARGLEAAPDAGALEALAERPDVARLVARYAPERPAPGGSGGGPPKKVWKIGKRELPSRLVPKRYRTRDGLEVWVGKSDEGNDLLTTRLARGRDLFFHLEGSPGSHVVLRVEDGEPPRESLLDAAELAVHFSKQKKATRAPVHVAAIKDVSKPRGAKPGLVYVHRGRTLQLKRSPERLKRVLESRIDD